MTYSLKPRQVGTSSDPDVGMAHEHDDALVRLVSAGLGHVGPCEFGMTLLLQLLDISAHGGPFQAQEQGAVFGPLPQGFLAEARTGIEACRPVRGTPRLCIRC